MLNVLPNLTLNNFQVGHLYIPVFLDAKQLLQILGCEFENLDECLMTQSGNQKVWLYYAGLQFHLDIDFDDDFLKFAQKKGLMPGKMVTVSKRDKMADTIELQLEKKSKFSLGFKSADKILVSG